MALHNESHAKTRVIEEVRTHKVTEIIEEAGAAFGRNMAARFRTLYGKYATDHHKKRTRLQAAFSFLVPIHVWTSDAVEPILEVASLENRGVEPFVEQTHKGIFMPIKITIELNV